MFSNIKKNQLLAHTLPHILLSGILNPWLNKITRISYWFISLFEPFISFFLSSKVCVSEMSDFDWTPLPPCQQMSEFGGPPQSPQSGWHHKWTAPYISTKHEKKNLILGQLIDWFSDEVHMIRTLNRNIKSLRLYQHFTLVYILRRCRNKITYCISFVLFWKLPLQTWGLAKNKLNYDCKCHGLQTRKK